VEDEFLSAGPIGADYVVEFQLCPFLQAGGFALRQIRFLRKAGLGQVYGLF
jgi:hypothetical protein